MRRERGTGGEPGTRRAEVIQIAAMLRTLLDALFARAIRWADSTATCRRVVGRTLTPFGYVFARCEDPSDPECGMDYCSEHCAMLCGKSGPDGDEDDKEVVWEPKVDARGREVMEA